jgi:hypothetical protein
MRKRTSEVYQGGALGRRDGQGGDYNHYHGYVEERHKPGCSRCARKAQAENLSINIYEWPVSAQEIAVKATIIELQLPEGFGDWRDTSTFLTTTVFRHRAECLEKPRSQYTL